MQNIDLCESKGSASKKSAGKLAFKHSKVYTGKLESDGIGQQEGGFPIAANQTDRITVLF